MSAGGSYSNQFNRQKCCSITRIRLPQHTWSHSNRHVKTSYRRGISILETHRNRLIPNALQKCRIGDKNKSCDKRATKHGFCYFCSMGLKELLAEATQLYIDNSSLRIGQALFNTLHANNPELADEVRGTVNDPFHADGMDDVRVKNFLTFIEGALNGKGK